MMNCKCLALAMACKGMLFISLSPAWGCGGREDPRDDETRRIVTSPQAVISTTNVSVQPDVPQGAAPAPVATSVTESVYVQPSVQVYQVSGSFAVATTPQGGSQVQQFTSAPPTHAKPPMSQSRSRFNPGSWFENKDTQFLSSFRKDDDTHIQAIQALRNVFVEAFPQFVQIIDTVFQKAWPSREFETSAVAPIVEFPGSGRISVVTDVTALPFEMQDFYNSRWNRTPVDVPTFCKNVLETRTATGGELHIGVLYKVKQAAQPYAYLCAQVVSRMAAASEAKIKTLGSREGDTYYFGMGLDGKMVCMWAPASEKRSSRPGTPALNVSMISQLSSAFSSVGTAEH